MAVRRLPAVRLTWDPYTDGDFVQYNVYRRERRAVYDARETADAVLSDGNVTDLVRSLGAFDLDDWPTDTVGVYPGATNYVTNGGFETGSTGWFVGTGNSLTRSTAQARFGQASLKLTMESGGNEYFGYTNVTVDAAGDHYAHFWAYVPSDYDGGTIAAHLVSLSGASGTTSANFNMALTDQWQHVVVGPFTLTSDLDFSLELYIPSATRPTNGRFIYVDGVQVEEDLVTPYIETSSASAERDDGRLQVPSEPLSATRGAGALRAKVVTAEPYGGSGFPTFYDHREDASNYLKLDYDEANNGFRLVRATTADGATAVSVAEGLVDDEEVTLAWYWNETTIGLSVNGGAFTTASAAAGDEFTSTLLDLGSLAGAQQAFADLYWFVGFAEPLTAAQAAVLHGYGNSAPSPEDLRDVADAVPVTVWDAREFDHVTRVDAADWVNVAVIAEAADAQYTDDRVASGRVYDFAVTVTANVFGNVLESEKQTPPVTGSCTFTDVYLQEVTTSPSRFAYLTSHGVGVDVRQEVAFVRPRGRSAPTAQVGEFEASRVTLSGVPRYHASEREEWERVLDLVRRQRTHAAVLLLRLPHVPERYFVQVDPFGRRDDIPTHELLVELQEVYFDESAS